MLTDFLLFRSVGESLFQKAKNIPFFTAFQMSYIQWDPRELRDADFLL